MSALRRAIWTATLRPIPGGLAAPATQATFPAKSSSRLTTRGPGRSFAEPVDQRTEVLAFDLPGLAAELEEPPHPSRGLVVEQRLAEQCPLNGESRRRIGPRGVDGLLGRGDRRRRHRRDAPGDPPDERLELLVGQGPVDPPQRGG